MYIWSGLYPALLASLALPFFFLASLPVGSPIVRFELKNFFKGHGARVVAWIKGTDVPPAPGIAWGRIRKDAIKDYEFGKPVDAFSGEFLTLSGTFPA